MINVQEAIRYLGFGRSIPDERTMELIHECIHEVENVSEPRHVDRQFDLNILDDKIACAAGISMHSHSLCKNLKGCESMIFFAATLGNGPDILLARYSRLQISKAAVFQAVAAAAIEAYCNEWQKKKEQELVKGGRYLRPRYSPGYGDLGLEYQPDFLRILSAQKTVGIILSEGGVMIPEKSVTAVLGISSEKTNCHIEGCEICSKSNCSFRRNGEY